MELVVAEVMAVLGKFAIDKGKQLLTEAGEAAVAAARDLFDSVVDRLKGDAATEVIGEGYEKDPAGYAKPAADQVAKAAEADPAFATQLQELLEAFKSATPAETYRLIVGSGAAVAINNSAAASGGSAAATDGSTASVGTVAPPPPPRERPPSD
jgi:hypothetical protein